MLSGEKEHNELIELKEKYKVPIFTLEEILANCEPAGRGYLTKEAMLTYACMPIGCEALCQEDDVLCVAISAELTSDEINNLKVMSGKKILVAAVALKENIHEAINSLANRGVMEAAQIGEGEAVKTPRKCPSGRADDAENLDEPKPLLRFANGRFVGENADGHCVPMDLPALRMIPKNLCRQNFFVPIRYNARENALYVVQTDFTGNRDALLMFLLKERPQLAIKPAGIASLEDISAAIEDWHGELEKREKELAELARKSGAEIIDLQQVEIDPEIFKLLPVEAALNHHCVVFGKSEDGCLRLAMADPTDIHAIDDVKFVTGCNVMPVVAFREDIENFIWQFSSPGGEDGQIFSDIKDEDEADVESVSDEEDLFEQERGVEDAPVVRLANLILIDGIRRNASHIHVEPYEKDFRVRLRVDGVLYEVMRPPMKLKNAIIARIKILAELDIANRLTPQAGKIVLRLRRGVERTFLVSTLPTPHGEKIMLKILHGKNDEKIHDLMHLGLEPDQYELMQSAVKKPGLILIAGPYDSGKNTTMKMLVDELNKTTANIVVVGGNDWNLPGINHTDSLDALNEAVRHQDADVIVIGKLDEHSMQIAMNAGAMGKKVIAGIDSCGDSAAVVLMLVNMGAPRYQIVNSVNFIVSQRLVRWLCGDCKKKAEEAEEHEILKELGVNTDEMKCAIYLPGQGCRECSKVTFKGRTAIFEILRLTDEMRESIANGADAKEIRAQAKKEHMMTLYDAGCAKVFSGDVSHKDILAMDLVK